MDIKIRKANGLDQGMISELLLRWLQETDLKYPGYCEYSNLWLADFLYNQVCFVAEVEGEIVGALGLKYSHFPWNNEAKALYCEFLMIDRAYRSNGTASKLIQAAKELAATFDVPIFMGIMTGNFADKKDKFLEICGFKYAGGNFVYGV